MRHGKNCPVGFHDRTLFENDFYRLLQAELALPAHRSPSYTERIACVTAPRREKAATPRWRQPMHQQRQIGQKGGNQSDDEGDAGNSVKRPVTSSNPHRARELDACKRCGYRRPTCSWWWWDGVREWLETCVIGWQGTRDHEPTTKTTLDTACSRLPPARRT